MVTGSASLHFLALQLREAIAEASIPGSKAPQYRPAREHAVRLARKLLREWEACNWREDLRLSLEQGQTYNTDHYRRETFRSHHARVTPGHYTGD